MNRNPTKDQVMRILDLHQTSGIDESIERFLQQRIAAGRTLSSVEEELVSQLPLFDAQEEQQLSGKAAALLKATGVINLDSTALGVISRQDRELGKQIKQLGLANFQKMLQSSFYEAIMPTLIAHDGKHHADVRYHARSRLDFLGVPAMCIEDFQYGGSASYRSALFHMLRHLGNISGGESRAAIESALSECVKGKHVLEIGSGPGFFLHLLQQYGAKVTGIDSNPDMAGPAKSLGVPLVIGDARELDKALKGEQYDLILSKDVLTVSVTKEDAYPIMQGACTLLRPGALSFHTIDYKLRSVERMSEFISSMQDPEEAQRLIANLEQLPPQEKEMLLRANILNIGPDSLMRIGYKPLTGLLLDLEDQLSIALTK